eukprot:g7287.t1
MARFEFCAATFREGGGVNRAVVCHHTSNASLRRRSFLSEFRPQFSPVLFKRKSHFFNSTNLRTRSRICPPVRAEYTDRPFKVEDYKRVRINTVTMVSQNPASGIMLLIEDKYGEEVEDPDPRGLMIQVGGDTLLGIAYKAADKEPERPMSLQLLNNVLERFETLNPNEWHLLHVAVVDIIDNTFIGRLYFGDPETDEIVWDCDCRPSDACWLALAHECRIYIHRSVWNNYAESLKKIYLEDSDVRTSLEKSILKPESTIKSTSELDPFTSVMFAVLHQRVLKY